jgi:hypothetical protein
MDFRKVANLECAKYRMKMVICLYSCPLVFAGCLMCNFTFWGVAFSYIETVLVFWCVLQSSSSWWVEGEGRKWTGWKGPTASIKHLTKWLPVLDQSTTNGPPYKYVVFTSCHAPVPGCTVGRLAVTIPLEYQRHQTMCQWSVVSGSWVFHQGKTQYQHQ